MRGSGRSVLQGAIAGAVAGLAASYVMNEFQEAVAKLLPQSGGGGDDPSTVKAAERVAGHELPKEQKPPAGNKVHFAFGCFLGAVYGAVAEVYPLVKTSFGMGYGVAVAAVADETAVPALRLAGPPWQTPASSHAFSLASHVVFGASLEAARRLLRPR